MLVALFFSKVINFNLCKGNPHIQVVYPKVEQLRPKYVSLQKSANHLYKQGPYGCTKKELETGGCSLHVQNHRRPLQTLSYSFPSKLPT